jgi:arginyl-tRNA synthetase
MTIELHLQKEISTALKALYQIEIDATDVVLQATRKEFEGSHTFVTFPFLKQSRKNPEQTAQEIGEYLVQHADIVSSFHVVKGFLNLSLDKSLWLATLADILSDERWGQAAPRHEKVMVEYSSPNTNKPLHLGHLRNNFLGFSVSQILKASGFEVVMANLVNDRGIHICKSMVAYQRFANGETPASSGLKGDHLAGKYYVLFDKAYKEEIAQLMAGGKTEEEAKKTAPILLEAQDMLKKWEAGDEAITSLWRQMNSWVYEGFDAPYQQMGVHFDTTYYESNTYLLGKDIVAEGLQKGVFFQKEDGSVWVDLSDEGMDEKLLLRSDGTSVYMTQDMGTADLKYKDYGCEKSVYVVGNEQDYHFKVLFSILKKLGRAYADGLYHLSYGMVDLPSGKMKSREGTVVDADDLMQEMLDTAARHTEELGKVEGLSPDEANELYGMLGLGALKFYLLRVDPKKRILFNPEESVEFQGYTAPFIQYTHARIASIRRRAEQLGIDYQTSLWNSTDPLLAEEELAVIRLLSEYTARLEQAAQHYDPAIIAQYAYDLAKEYNRFYAAHSIFNQESTIHIQFRVALSVAVAKTIKGAMKLLGIDVPERM